MGDIDIGSHARITDLHPERSFLRYLYDTVGLALLLTMAMVCFVIYAGFNPASAVQL